MSIRSFRNGLRALAAGFVIFAVALAALFVRGEDTRNVVERVDSACARAAAPSGTQADRVECDAISRDAAHHRSLADTCIPFEKAMTSDALRRDTRCPRKEVPSQTSPSASQPSGPPPGGSPAEPSKPSRPAEPTAPSEPEPPTEPTSPEPEPTAPAPSKPLIDLGPVTSPVCDLTRLFVNAC